jgi:tetracycline resistance efflux pump
MLVDHFGIWSIVPPLLAIGLAIWTKRVLLSLFAGIVVGLAIYTGSALETLLELVEVLVAQITDDWQARVLLFTVLLGGLLGIVHSSGGSRAFGKAAANWVTNRKKAQLATWGLGVLIFFDDYFNALTVGSVMRNVTDEYKVSREKLAYIIDSTAAPVCIIIPISTWIAYVISLYASEFERLGEEVNLFGLFLRTIPFNFYALAAIVMVVYLSLSDIEFGPMARAEKRAIEKGEVFDPATAEEIPGQDISNMKQSDKGTLWDLIVPILVLIGTVIVGLLYTGGFFDGVGFADAIGDADSATALVIGTLVANIVGIIMYLSRKVMSVKDCMENFTEGLKAMIPALSILILAWSIGEVAGRLGTGDFVAEIVSATLAPAIIPFAIFVVSAFMAFSTGTSWGTFAIMMPIGVPVAVATGLDPAMCIAALLGGAVFGDHSSPISDTTVLSSTGATCNHIDHVNTQLPYALLAAAIAAVGYIFAAILNQPYIPLLIVLALLYAAFYFLHKTDLGHTIKERKKSA